MKWILFIAVFGAGFGLGAWRAGNKAVSLLKAAGLLPLVLLALTAVMVGYILLTADSGDGFAGLAAASVVVLGVIMSLLALTGGMFGAWYRRAGAGER
ncbi:hypothetical protein [Sphingomonas glaciei]|uniref:Uncharacterized protein n=1 Tax=Sphingomonas glaciei TaxID=2938948 RepID=A0ABY5N2C6_9SPHN|nr:hypothetical protein [Sphingomonas glaciei]UUR08731.1 hypothetical protein M1K48_03605 [Sphingomonas glaciei]